MKRLLMAAGASLLLAGAAAAQADYQPRLGEPIRGLSAAEMQRFLDGKTAFITPLTPAQGVGPAFNDVSCGGCHGSPEAGGFSTRKVTRFGQMAAGGNPFDPLASLGGPLQQEQAISIACEEHIPVEADVLTERLTPITFGAGLLEGIPDPDIADNLSTQPAHLSGELRLVLPLEAAGPPYRLGRFGWKGDVATVLTFSADAGLNELGLTSELLMNDNAPNGDPVLLANCDTVSDPEDAPLGTPGSLLDKFTDFQRFLAAPPQTPKSGMAGEQVFNNVGCADCHLARTYVTGFAPEAALTAKNVKPYSDFLVHDVGRLGDGFVHDTANENEFQTRALWGVRARGALLHDGRSTGGTFSDNVKDAVAEHGGEAALSRAAFNALTGAEQDQLIAFLDSLGRAEFDWEGDSDVDEFDWFFMQTLMTGPGGSITPDDVEAVADVNRDGSFDLYDALVMQRAFTGQ